MDVYKHWFVSSVVSNKFLHILCKWKLEISDCVLLVSDLIPQPPFRLRHFLSFSEQVVWLLNAKSFTLCVCVLGV